ncbi:hypothetical protein FDP41_011967 [Naegleria fowleri]|uniref:Uncharacterized protein n=1 Tax=Naegleria fowleri TaxID=5763 RepID=A0A6A5C309_NAEFO|nr:uncharacterized protein FDP41_011967 [Naegleria fowleri]KAF0982106.1 hypothetical protein FDP41_011967 [Naegleria fowleri]CAG4719657.1 unnamed protein product [Naegleria fowleri]
MKAHGGSEMMTQSTVITLSLLLVFIFGCFYIIPSTKGETILPSVHKQKPLKYNASSNSTSLHHLDALKGNRPNTTSCYHYRRRMASGFCKLRIVTNEKKVEQKLRRWKALRQRVTRIEKKLDKLKFSYSKAKKRTRHIIRAIHRISKSRASKSCKRRLHRKKKALKRAHKKVKRIFKHLKRLKRRMKKESSRKRKAFQHYQKTISHLLRVMKQCKKKIHRVARCKLEGRRMAEALPLPKKLVDILRVLKVKFACLKKKSHRFECLSKRQ